MNLSYNDFELFGLPQRQAQERADIDARWKELQREAHPDRFAGQGATAQRAALQWSVRINEAYRRLKDPLRRAAYLCELRGAPIDAENNTAMPTEFLMEQMEWREALDEARGEDDLDELATRVLQRRREMLARIQQLLDLEGDAPAAAQQVRALMFIERFASDVEARLAQLGQ
jgi:molecular chaperone HscB